MGPGAVASERRLVLCDAIVHRRGTSEILLAVEAKRTAVAPGREPAHDRRILAADRDRLAYRYAHLVAFEPILVEALANPNATSS